ncbi:hypothetical protein MT418_008410 [Batrachochytrium dendrobatidis]
MGYVEKCLIYQEYPDWIRSKDPLVQPPEGGDPPWAKAHAVGDSRAAQNLLGENHSSREEVIRIRGGLNLEESGTRSLSAWRYFFWEDPQWVDGPQANSRNYYQ